MTEQRPLKVFLCHASADKPAVRRLYRYLRERKMDPWLDAEKLLPGQNWQVEIPKALLSSDVIVICLSKNSVDKEGYVQKEIKFALDKALEMPEGRIFLIPARLEECDLPHSLSAYHYVNLFEDDGYKRLLRSLRVRAEQIGAAKVSVNQDTIPPDVEKTAREKAERETAEKAARDKTEREKAEREKAEREAAEKTAREKVEHLGLAIAMSEITEREAKEKLAREKEEREAAEKTAREKAEREAFEKARRENLEPPVGQIATSRFSDLSRTPTQKKEQEKKPVRKLNFRKIGIIGFILIALFFWGWGIKYLLNRPVAEPTPTTSIFATPSGTDSMSLLEQFATGTARARTAAAPTITFTSVPPTFIPTPSIGSTMLSEKDGMTLVFVPAGGFVMGSDNGSSDEQPIHTVSLDSYWIDKTEVTNKMYALCVQAGVCQPPSSTSSYTRKDYYGNFEFDDYPVIYVDWNKAKTYCEWAGRRLPTEAEWEKAARGTDARTYPWGNDAPSNNLLNYNSNTGDTTEVGKYPAGASIYGALDMAGNVWEWVSSLYQSYPYSASDGREDLNASGSRVFRGGSWSYYGSYVRSALRYRYDPSFILSGVGFRCALSP
jgi:formylglycine-generating enzyme required for sulfatase activity